MSGVIDSTIHVSVLYFQKGTIRQPSLFHLHQHDFWQLEWLGGVCELLQPGGTEALSSGDVILLPPGTIHGFRYAGRNEEFLSAKFHVAGIESPAVPTLLRSDRLTVEWGACAEAILEKATPESRAGALGGLIEALLHTAFGASERLPSEVRCVRRAREFISENSGRSLTVNEVARHAGVSRGHLSAAFRASAGETVKACIDRHRLRIAQDMLRYADLSVSQIAEELSFPDIFSFSRFFKNHYGASPVVYRKRVVALG